jgi:hypothetical protein
VNLGADGGDECGLEVASLERTSVETTSLERPTGDASDTLQSAQPITAQSPKGAA